MHFLAKAALMMTALGSGAALWAQGDNFAPLRSLQRGKWIVTPRDGGPPRALCLGDPAQLVQLGHRGAACSRYLDSITPDRVTVQYTCRGNGYGRTSIRRETSGLVQIESEGVRGRAPFEIRAEARRVGPCR